MSLMTYDSARPWAKAIKTAVLKKQMPPWFADPHIGEFRNAPKLMLSEINTLVAWADSGAREGDAADKPADREWKEGWRIQPDVVVSMPVAYHVEANGPGEIREFFIRNPFTEDTWVSGIEIRPGDPSVVHHVIVQVPDQTDARIAAFESVFDAVTQVTQATQTAQATAAEQAAQLKLLIDDRTALALGTTPRLLVNDLIFGRAQGGSGLGAGGSYNDLIVRNLERQTGIGAFMTMEAVYAPGTTPLDFRYNDSAKLIPGGKPIRIEVHYTPNGKETMDRTQVAFTLARTPAQRRFVIMAPEHLVDSRIPIWAGNPNFETKGELTFVQDADLVWFMPHMHLRGKDMSYKLIFPDGKEKAVLSVNYNFNWQLGYELKEPIRVTKGTRMIVTAHHDNSANNPLNPSPDVNVGWGDLTSQEMMLPWFGVLVNRDAKPQNIASYRPGELNDLFVPKPTVGRSVTLISK